MSLVHRPRRSALYMPASNPRAVEKARSLACDVVILDLEDSVLADLKPAAREAAVAALREGGFGRREVVVRVNALATPWGGPPSSSATRASRWAWRTIGCRSTSRPTGGPSAPATR